MKRLFLGAVASLCLLAGHVPAALGQNPGNPGSNVACNDINGNPITGCGSTSKPISASLLGATAGSVAGFVNVASDSALTSAISAAGSVPTVLQFTQGVSITSAHTIPSNIAFRFDTAGELLSGGGSIAFAEGRQIQTAVNHQIFASGLTVTGMTGDVPVEWFGAVGNGTTSGGGTDSTAAIQATLNAISSGNALFGPHIYITSAALSITRPNLGVVSTSQGHSYPANSPASVIESTSATADVLDLTGTSSTPLVWSRVDNVSLQRSVVPTGTATAGLNGNFLCGANIKGVTVQDSTVGFHMHAAAGCGFEVQDSGAGWGYLNVAKSNYTSQNLIGWYLDSADGNAENTIYLRNTAASFGSSNSAANAVGMLVQGTAINDVNVDFFNTAYIPVGLKVNQTGSANYYSSQDLHFHWLTVDSSSGCAVSINGVSGSTRGSLTLDDYYLSGTGTGICASNSAGLNFGRGQILSGGTQFGSGVTLSSVTNSIISGNLLQGTTALSAVSSPGNIVSANVMQGNVSLDSGSLTNWAANTVSGSISDASGSVPQISSGNYTNPVVTYNKFGVPLTIASGAASTTCGQGYLHSVPLTVSASAVSGGSSLSSFPMLVSFNGATTNSITLANLKSASNGGQVQSANGYDIIFCSAASGGTQLAHELVTGTYSPTTGAAQFYVNTPTLASGAATTIYAFWDNSSATNTANASGVWTNGYAAVYHLANNGGAVSGLDSTSYANNLTNSGATVATSTVGGGAAFTASQYMQAISPKGLATGTNPRTVEAWANVPSSSTGDNYMVSYGTANSADGLFSVDYSLSNGGSVVYAGVSGQAFIYPQTNITGSWHSFVTELASGTTSGSTLAFVDGVQKTGATCYNSGTCADTLNTTAAYIMLNGVDYGSSTQISQQSAESIAEVRISNVARTAGWLATEYANQSNPSTFFTLGTVN